MCSSCVEMHPMHRGSLQGRCGWLSPASTSSPKTARAYALHYVHVELQLQAYEVKPLAADQARNSNSNAVPHSHDQQGVLRTGVRRVETGRGVGRDIVIVVLRGRWRLRVLIEGQRHREGVVVGESPPEHARAHADAEGRTHRTHGTRTHEQERGADVDGG